PARCRRGPAARSSASGAPTARASPTSRTAAPDAARWLAPRSFRTFRLLRSCRGSLLSADHRDEQVCNAGGARLAEPGDLVAIGAIEQEHAAAEHLSLVQRLERARRGGLLRPDQHFDIAAFEILHAAVEHEPSFVDEHDIG